MRPAGKKEKGSAEAATSPSRGSNDPYQEMAMNGPTNSTAWAAPATLDFQKVFDGLDSLVLDLVRRAKATDFLVDRFADKLPNEFGGRVMGQDECDAISSAVQDLRSSAIAIEKLHDQVYKAVVRSEGASAQAGRRVTVTDEVPCPVFELTERLRFLRREGDALEEATADAAGERSEPHGRSLRTVKTHIDEEERVLRRMMSLHQATSLEGSALQIAEAINCADNLFGGAVPDGADVDYGRDRRALERLLYSALAAVERHADYSLKDMELGWLSCPEWSPWSRLNDWLERDGSSA